MFCLNSWLILLVLTCIYFRYGFLLLENHVSWDPLSISVAVLQQFNVLPEMYQVGYTKLYIRSGQVISWILQRGLNSSYILSIFTSLLLRELFHVTTDEVLSTFLRFHWLTSDSLCITGYSATDIDWKLGVDLWLKNIFPKLAAKKKEKERIKFIFIEDFQNQS